jgi:hypothetical protein
VSRAIRARYDGRAVVALSIGVGWAVSIWFYTRRLSGNYFPIADEWALIANSDPHLTNPLEWLTSGFSEYFESDPILSQPYANFLRPLVNVTYWLLGLVFSPTSPGRLYFNFAVIGGCAALTYYCAANSAEPRKRTVEMALAAAVPLMPAFLPSFIELTPYNAFDALAAAIALLAYLAAERNRHALTVALLVLAVFTKETALPIAAAVPASFLFRNRTRLRQSPILVLRASALALPMAAWVIARRLAFGSFVGGTYTWTEDMAATLAKIATLARHWPLPSIVQSWWSPWSLVPLTINAILVAGSIAVVGARLQRRIPVDLAEVCWLFSYGAMLLVGVVPRYGATVDVFLILAVVRAHQAGILRTLTSTMVLAVAICAALSGYFAWRTYPQVEELTVGYFRVAKRYVTALQRYGPRDTVVVLNDPVTWHARVRWLTAVAGVSATVVKAMDFSCPASPERLRVPCNVSLRSAEGEGRFDFTEDCGLDFCGATQRPDTNVRRTLLDGIFVDLPRVSGREDARPVWNALTLTVQRPNVFLMYFDPHTRRFEQTHVP